MVWALVVGWWLGACAEPEGAEVPQVLMEGPEWPHVRLHDGRWDLVVVDPVAEAPYYQGRRFALSGMAPMGRWDGIPLFGELTAKEGGRNPEHHDHLGGLADEFDINGPDSFAGTAAGGVFMKIGVGFLRRPDDRGYSFSRKYEVVARPEITVERTGAEAVRFVERLHDEESGLGYELVTELVLRDGVLESRRTLGNLCNRVLETEFYGHHFLRLNDVPPGPAYRVLFPKTGEPDRFDAAGGRLVRTAEGLEFSEPLEKGSYYFGSRTGLGWAAGSVIRVQEVESGVEFVIGVDHEVDRFAVWGTTALICPEPFLRIRLEPGQSRTWTMSYRVGRLE